MPFTALFACSYGIGAGTVSALGYYHITQPSAIRAGGDEPQRAVVVLTIFGAFASPIFLPLTAWLAQSVGWRETLRIQALFVAITFLVTALLGDAPASGRSRRPAPAGVYSRCGQHF